MIWWLILVAALLANLVGFITAVAREHGGWTIAHGLTLCVLVIGAFW